MATETIQIIVTQSGAVSVSKDIEGVGVAARSSAEGTSLLTGALTALISVEAGKYLIDLTSDYTDLLSRITLATGGIDEGNAVMSRIEAIAARTYSSLNQTAEGFIQNDNALKELGFSTNKVLDYTEALNNALVVSGAKGERAAQVSEALAKAMNLGKLSGIELRTVLSEGDRVAELLADQLNTTKSSLYSLGMQGKITGDVISQALIGNLEKLRKEADAMPATIVDGINRIKLAFTIFVGSMDQAKGISGELGKALVFVADNLGVFLAALSPLAVALTIFATQTIAIFVMDAFTGLIGGLTGIARLIVSTIIPSIVGFAVSLAGLAVTLITETIPAVAAFTLALLANPLFLLGAAAVAAGVYYFRDSIKALGEQILDTATKLTDLNSIGKWVGDKFTIDLTGKELSEEVKRAMNESSRDAATNLKDGVAAGGKDAAASLKVGSAEAALAIYQALNGVPQTILGAVKAGADYTYNQVTGAVERSTVVGGKTLGDGVVAGSRSGATIMADAIVGAGQTSAREIAIQAAQAVQAAKGFSSNSVSLGLGFIPGSSGALGPWQNYSYGNRSNGQRGSNLSPAIQAALAQEETNRNSGGAIQTLNEAPAGGGLTINNYVDPNSTLQAIDTQKGNKTVVNVIKANATEVKAILGIN